MRTVIFLGDQSKRLQGLLLLSCFVRGKKTCFSISDHLNLTGTISDLFKESIQLLIIFLIGSRIIIINSLQTVSVILQSLGKLDHLTGFLKCGFTLTLNIM